MSAPRRHFVILGLPRSGTSLLARMLHGHPRVWCPGELLLMDSGRWPARHATGTRQQHGYVHWLRRSRARRLRHALPGRRPALVRAYLDEDLGRAPREVAGFKLMVDQARRHPAALDWLAEHGARVVRLRRRNALAAWVSWRMLMESGVAHADRPHARPRLHLPTGSLLAALRHRSAREAEGAAMLPGAPSLELSYEDLAADPPAVGRGVLRFLGADDGTPLVPTTARLMPADPTAVIRNLDEVAAVLAGTEFEWCLGGAAPTAAGTGRAGAATPGGAAGATG